MRRNKIAKQLVMRETRGALECIKWSSKSPGAREIAPDRDEQSRIPS
jgi:hypothetical protein